MIQDKGPIYNLGFGVTSRDTAGLNDETRTGPNPNSGFLSKALNDHPFMRFLAVTAATITGAAVAGAVVRKGGVRLGVALQEMGSEPVTRTIKEVREIRDLLDNMQGVARTAESYLPENADKLFWESDIGAFNVGGRRISSGTLRDGELNYVKGWYQTYEEKQAASRLSARGVESVQDWTLKDELKQRLITQARRMPYELPGAYVAQRAVIDPLFGTNDNERPVNWANPLDVVSDFVTQSVSNAAFMFGPFEGAQGAATHGYRHLMSTGLEKASKISPIREQLYKHTVSLKGLLSEVGQDATTVLNRGIELSSKTTGAFSSAVRAQEEAQGSLVDLLFLYRHGVGEAWDKINAKSISRSHKWAEKAQALFNLEDPLGGKIPVNPLDYLPSPFGGLAQGIGEGKLRWETIGAQKKALNNMLSGKRITDPAERRALSEALQSQSSPLDDLLDSLNKFGRGGPVLPNGQINPQWKRGDFYSGRMDDLYNTRFRRELRDLGVSKEDVYKFQQTVGVSNPLTAKDRHLTERIRLGSKNNITADSDSDAWNRVAMAIGAKNPDKLNTVLPQALERADQAFFNKGIRSSLDRQIEKEWNVFYNEAYPRLAESVLGHNRLPYQMFQGPLTRQKHDFLTRKTAEMTGLSPRDEVGKLVSDAITEDHLKRVGFDPTNLGQMRAFLAKRKLISAPWNKDGRNVFGMRPVSMESALARGYFSATAEKENEVRSLIRTMKVREPWVSDASFKVPGLYETAHGQILDLNVIRKGFRRFSDKLAEEFQIPLIHLSPFKTAGWSDIRSMREAPMLQYISGNSFQPFLNDSEQNASFYIWAKASRRGTKGTVTAIGTDAHGLLKARDLPGKYHPMNTIGNTIAARQIKIASGDAGRVPVQYDQDGNPIAPSRFDRFKRLFDISDHQPDSLLRWTSRFRKRKTDINNPVTFARLLRGETIEAGDQRLRLVNRGSASNPRYVVRDLVSDSTVLDASSVTQAFDKFPNLFRARGIPHRVLGLEGMSEVFSVRLDPDALKGKGYKVLDPTKDVSVGDLKTPAQFKEFIDAITKMDTTAASRISPEVEASARRAQSLLLFRHLRGESGSSYWDSRITGATGSLSTRLDQLRADLERYMVTREGLGINEFLNPSKPGAPKQSFDNRIAGMLGRLQQMRSKGGISQAQYIEARTAILGSQLDYSNFQAYSRGVSTQGNIQAGLHSFLGRSTSKDLLGEVTSGNIYYQGSQAGWTGRLGKLKPWMMRKYGSAPYEYQGLEYNPFQNGPALVPTLGTSMARNPVRAMASVAGLNTWSDPSSFSSASILSGHFIERLNHSLGIFGGSLDPTKYMGPVDLFARGMVGRRALPLMAAGATAIAADRTIGGYLTPRDEQGNKVYRPFFLGGAATAAAYGQSALAGIIPGGQTYEQKRKELFEGEVPIRSGRWWPLGNTPWKGGRVQYYRPSWYRRLMSGSAYTGQLWDTPLEKLGFGYDFSPGRLLDPYRFEREHYRDRPYPTTGEYFTGPWGPLTSTLNMTVGRLLKPQIGMHDDEVASGLTQYLPTGQQGAYFAPPGTPGQATIAPLVGGGATGSASSFGAVYGGTGVSAGGTGRPAIASPSAQRVSRFMSANTDYLAAAGKAPLMTGRNTAFSAIDTVNATYEQAAYAGDYGPSGIPGGMSPKIMGAAPPLTTRNLSYQTRQLGYEAQELFGIYGFAFGSIRDKLGLGNMDMTTPRPVLESASRAYSSTRAFWNLGLGGLGDMPSPLEGNYANLEVSEILRRFIPKERPGTQFVNPIQNTMGQQYPWLPGSNSGYYLDFTTGDPYTKVPEGEMRLPGLAYERLNGLHPDEYGNYGLIDIHNILGDVAPWSKEYRSINRMVDRAINNPQEAQLVEQTRAQVEVKAREHDFKPYQYRYSGVEGLEGGLPYAAASLWERFQHADTPFHTKFMNNRTALEDWERNNVYGQTFPQWQNPISDFIEPMMWGATQRNPFGASALMAATGSFFARSAQGKAAGAIVGGILGFASSVGGHGAELLSGRRYMPTQRRQEAALEEYTDILTYVKNMHLSNQAAAAGDTRAASEFKRQASSTMYGVDIYNAPIQQLVSAVPRRRREYMQAFVNAPEQERDQILSTAPRLERRILQAVWGRPVESRPELEDYFQSHELPAPESSLWHPNTSMDQIKIKMGQSMGLDLAQMGVYPQEIQAANLVNPAYPSINERMSKGNVTNKLRTLLRSQGISGDVYPVHTPYGGTRVELQSGVYA